MLILPFITYAIYKERIKQKERIEIQQEIERRNAENRLAKKIAEEMKKAD